MTTKYPYKVVYSLRSSDTVTTEYLYKEDAENFYLSLVNDPSVKHIILYGNEMELRAFTKK